MVVGHIVLSAGPLGKPIQIDGSLEIFRLGFLSLITVRKKFTAPSIEDIPARNRLRAHRSTA